MVDRPWELDGMFSWTSLLISGRWPLRCGIRGTCCLCLGLVGLRDGSSSLRFEPGECSHRIYVLRDDHALVVHLVDEAGLAIGNVENILPVGDLPHVSPWPSKIAHHLSNSVHTVHAVGVSNGCKPRSAP